MSGGFSNKPKILRGAFFEYGLSIPPLIVPFQFNPEQLTRSRSNSYSVPNREAREALNTAANRERTEGWWVPMREFHQREEYSDLGKLREEQQVSVQEETINFELKLDATDDLNDGDPITGEFGVGPRLSTLELMVMPKQDSIIGKALESLVTGATGHSFTRSANPPMILFIWGRTRVVPVNINSMNITETEFNTVLSPIRATVSISMTVIEGANPLYKVTTAATEIKSLLNLANIADVADVLIPG